MLFQIKKIQLMEVFKYSLDKSSRKYICPNCKKKRFVYYVDTETGNYLSNDYGKCDRKQNCNYHKSPSKGKKGYLIPFLNLKVISNKAHKLIDVNGVISIIPTSQILEQRTNSCFISEWYLRSSIINYLNSESKFFSVGEPTILNEVKTIKPPQPQKPDFHSLLLQDSLINRYKTNSTFDNLTTFLLYNFSFDEVDKTVSDYYLTGTDYFWKNSTIFWQIDTKEQIRAAKIMLYDIHTGKRIKKPYNHINWLHKAIKKPSFNLCQCLFGLHLINEDYQKDVAIVESEKTAITMSIYLPEFIWLATGSSGNFKYELLKPLKKRKCFAFPDNGEFTNWSNKAKELRNKGFKIEVSNILERREFEKGFDLADYYFLL